MPISDAREHLADVVNRAVYGGEATYLTRRGRRLAVIVSPAELAAGQARAAYAGVVEACRQMWADAAGKDEATRELVRGIIDRAVEIAEDTADFGVVVAMREDRTNGAEPEPWEQVKAELGL
jgi:prevent-host-death family protein